MSDSHSRSIRRGFLDVAEGQIHYRELGDPSLRTLLMFHASPASSYTLMPIARHLAPHRHIIAPDMLGNGDSSPPAVAEVDIAYLADAHLRALDALKLDKVDLYGYHTGTHIAIEVAIAHPDRINRVVLDGLSLIEGAALLPYLERQAPDLPPDPEGTQLLTAWHMIRDAHVFAPWWNRTKEGLRQLPFPSADYLHGEVIELLKGARTYRHSYRAAMVYKKRERWPLLDVPIVVLGSPSDPHFKYLDETTAMVPGAISAVVPGIEIEDDGLLGETADRIMRFLDHGA